MMDRRMVCGVVVAELAVSIGILYAVPFTNIDWAAYMEEVEGFLGGELDYSKLEGGTGPLVYPAGFVWLYSVLFFWTKGGVDVRMAQWCFVGLYGVTVALVADLHRRVGIPWWTLVPLMLSRRIHSLYMLRLFNDCWAIGLLLGAIYLLAVMRKWRWGTLMFSVAVSVKMNVLLGAPGLLCVLLRSVPRMEVLRCLCIAAGWQLFVALPFLILHPCAYVKRSFDVGRVFTHRWSVNYQFVPENIFVHPLLGGVLLFLTLVTWGVAWRRVWCYRCFAPRSDGQPPGSSAVKQSPQGHRGEQSKGLEASAIASIALTMMESNLIGVAFARTLHYQFYTWCFWMLPFVLTQTRLPWGVQVAIWCCISQGFERYPPTPLSSLVLQIGMGLMVVGFFYQRR